MNGFLKSFIYALNGIGISFRDHRNLKVQALIALLTVSAGFYFGITPVEWCLALLSIAMVMGMEMINTAIESLVDLVTQEHKPIAGRVKDVAAGAVLFVCVLAVIVGFIIFRKYLF